MKMFQCEPDNQWLTIQLEQEEIEIENVLVRAGDLLHHNQCIAVTKEPHGVLRFSSHGSKDCAWNVRKVLIARGTLVKKGQVIAALGPLKLPQKVLCATIDRVDQVDLWHYEQVDEGTEFHVQRKPLVHAPITRPFYALQLPPITGKLFAQGGDIVNKHTPIFLDKESRLVSLKLEGSWRIELIEKILVLLGDVEQEHSLHVTVSITVPRTFGCLEEAAFGYLACMGMCAKGKTPIHAPCPGRIKTKSVLEVMCQAGVEPGHAVLAMPREFLVHGTSCIDPGTILRPGRRIRPFQLSIYVNYHYVVPELDDPRFNCWLVTERHDEPIKRLGPDNMSPACAAIIVVPFSDANLNLNRSASTPSPSPLHDILRHKYSLRSGSSSGSDSSYRHSCSSNLSCSSSSCSTRSDSNADSRPNSDSADSTASSNGGTECSFIDFRADADPINRDKQLKDDDLAEKLNYGSSLRDQL